MILTLFLILTLQLLGEALSQVFALPLPGPVAGMLMLLVALTLWPGLAERMRGVATVILGNLALLFVPAGVGVVGHLDRLAEDGPGLLLAVLVSTALAIVVGAAAFVFVARLSGQGEGAGEGR